MANKQLTAKVRLNTTQAEKSIDSLVRKINQMDKLMNRVNKQNNQTQQYAKNNQQVNSILGKVRAWADAQKQVANGTKSTSNALTSIGSKLKAIAATYLGIMGARAVVDTTDLLVGAQNRLNHVNGGDVTSTQEALDKMYASSQKTRSSYQDMISNVSKTMTLAGDAFGGNIDNAIRFQEIMAEAYAVGGASAQEKSTSMYQLTQALGSGYLQGDELRSVREGAPLAYQAIEEFAQGVYNSEKSLKDLASQGLITSEMVVAAVMNMGDGIDAAFKKTRQTFGQTFDQIRNSALYAFQPVMETLTDMLNKAVKNGLIQKFEVLFTNIAKAILIAFKAIEIAVNWVADNWDWLKYIVLGAVGAIIASLGTLAITAISTAVASFLAFILNNPFGVWLFGIGLLVAAFVWLTERVGSTCEAIYQICYTLAQAIIGLLTVVLVIYLATGNIMMSLPMLIALFVIGILAALVAAFAKWGAEIVGIAFGAYEVLIAVFSWIGNGFANMCHGMSAWFWNAVADMLEGVEWLLNGINKIREAFNYDPISVEGLRAKAKASESLMVENDLNVKNAFNKGYNEGYAIGDGWQDKINGFGEKLKNLGVGKSGDKTSLLDEIGKKLGLDFSGMVTPFPSEGAGSGYSPDLSAIRGNTDKMADSMELTAEDLEYLRRVAEMEWKKEYTTANITLDVTNNNNVNSDLDVFGIAHKISEVLYEEMDYMANGAYAY